VLAIAGATLVAHLAVAWRHGFFRDELYFIDCGRHPAFGYVDQPPLVPLVAAATQLFGHCLVALRAVAGLAHAGTVVVCAALAGLVAGEAKLPGRFARRMAEATVGATFGVPYAMPYERDRPILLCRGLHGGLRSMWSKLVHID
jgi:hypothetical protein